MFFATSSSGITRARCIDALLATICKITLAIRSSLLPGFTMYMRNLANKLYLFLLDLKGFYIAAMCGNMILLAKKGSSYSNMFCEDNKQCLIIQ